MTATMRLLRRLLIAALLVAAFVPAVTVAAAKRAPVIKSAWSSTFPNEVHGTSVAIGPGEVPWFGLSVQRVGLPLAQVRSQKLEVEPPEEEKYSYDATTALQFDSQGNLWFATYATGIDRRDPSGSVTKFELPKGEPVTALTIGPEGDIWFTRGGYGEKTEARVGRMTPAGAVTQFRLEAGSHPVSIAAGPDGSLWFSEEEAGKIGRITTSGEVQLFPLAAKVDRSRSSPAPTGPSGSARTRGPGRTGNSAIGSAGSRPTARSANCRSHSGKAPRNSPPIRAG